MDNIESYREQRLTEEITKIRETLTQVSAHPQLPERIFVGVFLPMFAGDNPLPYDVSLDFWINVVAQSPFSPVDVVDQQHNVLFTVPPVYDQTAIQPVPPSDQHIKSIAEVVATSDQLARLHPSQGEHYLNAELNQRSLIMRQPANVLRHAQTWNAIFERYGRPPLVALVNKAETEATDKATPGDDYEFEPL